MDGKTTKAVTKLEGSKFSFLNPFLLLAAEKKDSKNGAARKFFGPSYFDPTLLAFWLLSLFIDINTEGATYQGPDILERHFFSHESHLTKMLGTWFLWFL